MQFKKTLNFKPLLVLLIMEYIHAFFKKMGIGIVWK